MYLATYRNTQKYIWDLRVFKARTSVPPGAALCAHSHFCSSWFFSDICIYSDTKQRLWKVLFIVFYKLNFRDNHLHSPSMHENDKQ